MSDRDADSSAGDTVISVRAPQSWLIKNGHVRVIRRSNTLSRVPPFPLLLHEPKKLDVRQARAHASALGSGGIQLPDEAFAPANGIIAALVITEQHDVGPDCRLDCPEHRPGSTHLLIGRVVPFVNPVPCPGSVGMWRIRNPKVSAAVARQLDIALGVR